MINLKDIKIRKFMSKSDVNILISNYIELMDDVFLGSNYPHNWKCKCGNTIIGRRWGNIQTRNNTSICCEECSLKKIKNNHKLRVESLGGYEYINTYFKGEILPNGKIAKRTMLEVKHTYCGNIYVTGTSNILNSKQQCSNCCGSYENSFVYYLEKQYGKKLDEYWDFSKNIINPKFISKGSNKYIWCYCQKNKNHGSYEVSCSDFVRGVEIGSGCKYCNTNNTHYTDSIGYKYPHIAEMIVDDIDIYSTSSKSPKKFYFKCHHCGTLSDKKISLNQVVTKGYRCKVCSDGITVPEKFMRNILTQTNIEFIHHKRFSWSDNKEYDFYIPSLNLIIETHGIQHYKECEFFTKTTLKKVQDNDNYKYNLAKKNNISIHKYIIIDCRHVKFEYLKNNIINKLNNILDLSTINWELAWADSQNSLTKESWDLWNSGFEDVNYISNYLGISKRTIIRYLNIGRELNLCTYNPKLEMKKTALKNAKSKKAVKCLFTNKSEGYFPSIKYACDFLGISRPTFLKIMENAIP